MTEYVELHARSAFSFLEGASLPEELAAVCAELGMSTMALLDNNGVYGTARLHMAMKRLGLRGLVGSEVTIQNLPQRHRGTEIQEAGGGRQEAVTRNSKLETRNLPLLVESRTGYQNLCRLITKMKLRVPKHSKPGECAAAAAEELREHAKGLVCLTGDEHGPLA